MNTIDLHMHSLYSSDGEYAVSALIDKAKENNIKIIAIADHNTTKAHTEAVSTNDVCVIPAVELDCTFRGHVFHLLGYGIDPHDERYAKNEQAICEQEQAASSEVLALLKQHLHIYVDEDELKRRCPKGIYVAETICEVAMLDARNQDNPYMKPYYPGGDRSDNPYVNFYWDHCSQGKEAYVPIQYMTMEEAIALYRSQHAMVVLAHPGNNIKEDDALLHAVMELSLDGLEVYSSYHTPEQIAYYKKAAQAYGLCMTCGSDFHGKTKPSVFMGNCHMPKEEEDVLHQELLKRGLC